MPAKSYRLFSSIPVSRGIVSNSAVQAAKDEAAKLFHTGSGLPVDGGGDMLPRSKPIK